MSVLDVPGVSVLVNTYMRRDTLRTCLEMLHQNLVYPGALYMFVADDGAGDGTAEMLQAEFPHVSHVRTPSPRSGLGVNNNTGMRAALEAAEYILHLQDDMHLMHPLPLLEHVERLRDSRDDGMVRLWGVAHHGLIATMDRAHWRISWDSPELHIYSDRPHLKHWRFIDAVGYYTPGIPIGETEVDYAHRVRDLGRRGKCPHVLVPSNFALQSGWHHAGDHDSWNAQGF